MSRSIFSMALALGLVTCYAALATDAPPPIPAGDAPTAGQYTVHLKMVRVASDGTKATLAEPTLVVSANRQASFRSGGEQTAGDEQIPVGTAARLTLSPVEGHKVLVVGRIENSAIVDRGNGVLSRHSDEALFKRSVELGKVTRLPLSTTLDSTQWIEMTVEDGGELFDARQSAPAQPPAQR